MLEKIEQVGRLQAQEPSNRRLQGIIRIGGFRVIPVPVTLGVEAQPAPPRVQVPLDVVLARVVEQHGAVAELLLVGRHAEDVRGEHRRRLALVAVELVHRLAPVLGAREVALVLGDDERNSIHQQYHVLAALLHTLDAVLVGGGEVVQPLPVRLEGDEVDSRRVLARLEHDPSTIPEQVEGLAVCREFVGMGHRSAQRPHREPRLRIGLHRWIDAQDRRNQQRLDERVLERALVGRYSRLVPILPAEAAVAVFFVRLAAEPPEDGLFDVAVLGQEASIFVASPTRTRPVRRSCRRDLLS